MGKMQGSQAGGFRSTANQAEARRGKPPRRQCLRRPPDPPRARNRTRNARAWPAHRSRPDQPAPWPLLPTAQPGSSHQTPKPQEQNACPGFSLQAQLNDAGCPTEPAFPPGTAMTGAAAKQHPRLGRRGLPPSSEALSVLWGSPALFNLLGGCGSYGELSSHRHGARRQQLLVGAEHPSVPSSVPSSVRSSGNGRPGQASHTRCAGPADLSALNEGVDLHGSREIRLPPSPSLNRRWHALTGQIPGTLEGDWGGPVWNWLLLTLSKIFLYLSKVYSYRCSFRIGMISLENRGSTGWSSLCWKYLLLRQFSSIKLCDLLYEPGSDSSWSAFF